jgi:hypothetical protein
MDGDGKVVWIRTHHTPRLDLYAPTHAEFGGPDPQFLRPQRETRILKTDGSYKDVHDDWHHPSVPLNPSTPWTGQTMFFDKGAKRVRVPEQFDLSDQAADMKTWSEEQEEYLRGET